MNLLFPFEVARPLSVQEAISILAHDGDIDERGAVFTKTEVATGILDLCRYASSRDLREVRLLEPSCGDGEFLFVAAQRLIASCRNHDVPLSSWPSVLRDRIVAIELHHATFERTQIKLIAYLQSEGLTRAQATHLASSWLTQDDFLLAPITGTFDVVVGNPPYVRQERVPNALLAEYKRRFSMLYDRADLYVLFYERCLDLLTNRGVLGFICANRWVKNKYGGPLRSKVAKGFNLDYYIDLEQVDAFHEEVNAYPAITVIRRGSPGHTTVLTHGRDGTVSLDSMFSSLLESSKGNVPNVVRVHQVASGRDPWLLDAPDILNTLRSLEARLPTLEEAGAKVGIGVATGADRVYVGAYDELPIEQERLLPLAMSSDLKPEGLQWSGRGLVNPWLASGKLAPLDEYPKFAAYLREHESTIRKRHTAQKSPRAWYKTIDRVYPDLTHTPKLLIPDIKGEATVVYDEGNYYPHHNLYVVTSRTWDLRALQAILKSSVALMFVAAYGIRMAGGFLRFQAQYLRRIRIPRWDYLQEDTQHALAAISESTDQRAIDDAVFPIFSLSHGDAEKVRRFAQAARVEKKTP